MVCIRKIMYFMDFPAGIGGANKVLMTQANIMQQKGYQTLIVIPSDEKGYYISEYDQICRDYHLKTTTIQFSVATCIEEIDIEDVRDKYEEIKNLIQDFEPDLVHSTQLNIAVELAARELKIPHLMNIYQTDEAAFYIDWMKIYPQYHCADSILLSRRWADGLGIVSECIRVAYTPKRNEEKFYSFSKQKMISIISIGLLSERKNQLEIIKFVMKCKEKGENVKLTILGKADYSYGIRCQKFVTENGLQNEVVFKGFVLNVEDYLKEADLFILASTVESYPGVIVESMANRVPIISTAVAGVPELLKDGENGFLTSGYTYDNIYEAFLRYKEYCDTGKISNIINSAYDTFLCHHTYAAVGKKLEDYYQWIIEDYQNRIVCTLSQGEVWQKFQDFMGKEEQNRISYELRSRIWILYHISIILEKRKNRQLAIWGAGFWGGKILEWICSQGIGAEFVVFIDSYKQGEYLGHTIVEDKDSVIAQCETILVAIENEQSRREIMNYLEERGKVRNEHYFMLFNSPIRI